MLGFSFAEILFLAVLALVVIGPKQLPEVARFIGRFINEMKRASAGLTDELKKEIKVDIPDIKGMAAQRLMDNKIQNAENSENKNSENRITEGVRAEFAPATAEEKKSEARS